MRARTPSWAGIIALCLLCSCTRQEALGPIRIAINVWPGYAHAFIARDKGFFRKHGAAVTLVLKKDITEAMQLYRNGEVDGLFAVFPDIIMLNAEGIKTRVVYIADFSDTADVIIGKPEVRTLAELKNKKVSFEGINSFSHLFVLRALEEAGIREFEVQFANVAAMDVLDALEHGDIAAGHTWEPVTSRAVQKGYRVLARAGDAPGIIIDVLAFKAETIARRPDAIRRIIAAISEARDFMYAERSEAMEIMSRAEGIPPAELASGIEGVRHPDLRENSAAMRIEPLPGTLYASGLFIVNFYLTRGQLSHAMDSKAFVEPAYVQQLLGAGP